MENKYKWAVEEIYSSIEDWNKDFEWVSNNLDFNEFKGKLGDSKTFLQCMKAQEKVGRVFDKLSVYAMMKHDENTKDSVYDALVSKITSLSAIFSTDISP